MRFPDNCVNMSRKFSLKSERLLPRPRSCKKFRSMSLLSKKVKIFNVWIKTVEFVGDFKNCHGIYAYVSFRGFSSTFTTDSK